MVTTLNRHQNTLRLHGVNPQSGVGKVFLQDENKAYVNGDNMDLLTYYPNFFVFVSEKSGYRHLYQYSLTGTLMKQLTSGDWDVTDFYGYDDKTKSFYFQAAKNSPLSREVYKVDSKGVITPVLDDKGTNSANFSKGFKYVQHYNSSAEQPMKVSVKDNKGKTLRIVESNEKLINNLSSYEQLKKEFVVFNNGKGDQLNAYIVKPSDFDQTKKYPVVMVQYGGPGSQMVLDKWVFDWTAYLADQEIGRASCRERVPSPV